ncbi:hypothetical protein BaRGS_00035667, partial [Batillaria attramentaria]
MHIGNSVSPSRAAVHYEVKGRCGLGVEKDLGDNIDNELKFRTGLTPIAHCPAYAEEGGNFSCECQSRTRDHSCSLSWPGYTEGPILTMLNVTRQDNGKVVTCQMICNGVATNVTHTVRVPYYGPVKDDVRITGPGSFLVNGTEMLTLTIKVANTNPEPRYLWNVNCREGEDGKTCTFTPHRSDHGKIITCRVTNPKTHKSADAVYHLNLTYPPPSPPKVSGHTSPLHPGDTINCTVTGGKPPVSSVQLSCSNNFNTWSDEPDTIEGSTVTSSLVFINASEGEVRCQCSAVWEQPELYNQIEEFNISVLPYPTVDPGEKDFAAFIGGGVAAAVAVVAIVAAVYIGCKKKENLEDMGRVCVLGRRLRDYIATACASSKTNHHNGSE